MIACASVFLPNYRPLANKTLFENRAAYCLKHGYKQLFIEYPPLGPNDNIGKIMGFEKVRLILRTLEDPSCEFVWFGDCDGMVMNYGTKLESIASKYRGDIIVGSDFNGINCGSMIIKNTPTAKGYLNEILAHESEYLHEQAYFWKHKRDYITVAPQREMNAYDSSLPGLKPPHYNELEMEFKVGDFFMHWPAQNQEIRLRYYSRYKDLIVDSLSPGNGLIACCQPGKIGDSLFILPACRRLYEITGCKVDIYLQPWCEPARDFIKYQSYINKMITTAPEKTVEGRYQPVTLIPHPERYKGIYDISWTTQPEYPLAESFAECAGLPRDVGRDIRWEVPPGIPQKLSDALGGRTEYVVVHIRGAEGGGFKKLFEQFIDTCPLPCVVVGGKNEKIGRGIDMAGESFLEMAIIIANAKSYVGMFSSPLVIAQGFEMPKTCIFDGTSWWPKQIIMNGETEYLVNPTLSQVVESASRKLRVKRVRP